MKSGSLCRDDNFRSIPEYWNPLYGMRISGLHRMSQYIIMIAGTCLMKYIVGAVLYHGI